MTDIKFPFPPTETEISIFCAAARDGKINEVMIYINRYGKHIIDQRDDIDARAITWAAFNGHTEIVRLLLESGADINAPGTLERTALIYAVEGWYAETVRLLIDRGADPDIKDIHGQTALMIVQDRYPELVPMIEQGIERNRAAKEERAAAERQKEQDRLAVEKAQQDIRFQKLKAMRPSGITLKKRAGP